MAILPGLSRAGSYPVVLRAERIQLRIVDLLVSLPVQSIVPHRIGYSQAYLHSGWEV